MSKDDPVIVVDEHDKVVEQVPRWQADRDHKRYRITGIWLENSQEQVLIAQRGLQKNNDPGVWGPAASGTVDVGQTYLDNARQEVREELGIVVDELRQVVTYSYEDDNQKRFVMWFRGTTDEPLEAMTIEYPEVNAIQWVDKATLFEDIELHPEKYLRHANNWHSLFEDH